VIETSETIADLAAAMAVAQTSIEGALKDSNNPHFKSKYADLSAVWSAWQKVGPANGLSVMQFPGECESGRMEMTTLLAHKSGQWIKAALSIPLSKVDAQGYGSATTYARRYALAAAVGIAPEDDDGNAASNPKGAANDAPAKREASHSALKGRVRSFVHELQGCGDGDELSAFLATPDAIKLVKEVREKLPQWWEGWDEQPDGFTPLADLITNRQRECAQATANYMTA
jgi:hypothetical protein